jgi:putative DNA-invertase from lambdoid prophage Rac
MNGLAFDLSTPHGRMMVTILRRLADFERELLQERHRRSEGTASRPLTRTAAEIRPPKSSHWLLKAAAID